MKEHETPDWERLDAARSLRDVGILAVKTLLDMAANRIRIDTDFKEEI